MLNETQRAALVSEAKEWVGTPYRGWSHVKGVGADCGQFLFGVYRRFDLIPDIALPRDYSLTIAQHRESTEYMDLVDKFFRPITEAEAKPADLVCYKIGLAMTHAGIIASWPELLIQAEIRHGVSGTHGRRNPALRMRSYLNGSHMDFRTLRDEFCRNGTLGGQQ